ncbi:iron dependent repressor, N-terminal DNA binding domain protein [delta proteobacterium NaphS2]|nr:iron dependent repressor, N-terminal DNA binding domain protein [delta proteobacterium NaphS2]
MDKTVTNIWEEKPLTSAMEDYLEAIFDLDKEKKVVRVKDIAKRLNVKMPTVTSMLKTLSKRGLVHYEKYEYVEPTEEGSEVGREMRRRHGILSRFLTEILKIDAKTADEEACKMEHSLSSGTLDNLTDFMAFIQICPRVGENWLEHFEEYRRDEWTPEKCIAQSEVFSCEFDRRTQELKEEPASQKKDD